MSEVSDNAEPEQPVRRVSEDVAQLARLILQALTNGAAGNENNDDTDASEAIDINSLEDVQRIEGEVLPMRQQGMFREAVARYQALIDGIDAALEEKFPAGPETQEIRDALILKRREINDSVVAMQSVIDTALDPERVAHPGSTELEFSLRTYQLRVILGLISFIFCFPTGVALLIRLDGSCEDVSLIVFISLFFISQIIQFMRVVNISLRLYVIGDDVTQMDPATRSLWQKSISFRRLNLFRNTRSSNRADWKLWTTLQVCDVHIRFYCSFTATR